MGKTIITTDSASNPRNIDTMVPCVIIDGKDKTYYDMKKISRDSTKVMYYREAYERAARGEKLHTSSPNIGDYVDLIGKYIEEGYDVIHLSTSSGVSAGSVNASNVAAGLIEDEFENAKLTVIDTLTAGCGGTVINDYANNLIARGLPYNLIVKNLQSIKERILSTYYISKVEGFVRSGRAPHGAMLSDKLSLRYRIDINDKGKLYPKSIYRGNIGSQFMKYLKHLINEKNYMEYDPDYLAILITRLKDIDIEEAKDYIRSFEYFKESNIKEIPFYGVISSYGVEDQVGIGLIKKK